MARIKSKIKVRFGVQLFALLFCLIISVILITACSKGEVQEVVSNEELAKEEAEEESADLINTDWISNHDEVIASIRHGLREHSSRINIKFSGEPGHTDEILEEANNWIEEALAETDRSNSSDSPREGDYIRYQNGGYNIKVSFSGPDSGSGISSNAKGEYTVAIKPKYYLYHIQEEEASQMAAEILTKLGILADDSSAGAYTDYQKIKAIYDYVVQNIKYDYFHDGMWNYTLRSTIYAGLVKKSATCQGYCVTMYRLLKEAGIDCRIITGKGTIPESYTDTDLDLDTDIDIDIDSDLDVEADGFEQFSNGESGLHAWNIVYLDGKYYNLDATWEAELLDSGAYLEDDSVEGPEYRFFLKGSGDFDGHIPDSKFETPEFREQYPISEQSY